MNTKPDLNQSKCAPCEGGLKPLEPEQIVQYLTTLPDWAHVPERSLIRSEFKTKDFVSAVKLIGEVAKLAEKAVHHPDVHLERYRCLTFELTTHAVGGLTENDFILAAQISKKAPGYLKRP